MDRFARILATAGHVGTWAPAPGTAGSAIALVLYFLVILLVPGGRAAATHWTTALFAAGFCLVGVWAAGVAEKSYGRDANAIVVDEVAGMWVSLLLLPPSVLTALGAFFLFRLFDIVKPFPAGRAQHLTRGWGVMADDVVAALYANLATRVLRALLG